MGKRNLKIRALVGALLAAASWAARSDEVTVAVAANFAGPLTKIGEGFSAAIGHTLKVSAG
jgi:molybdate transport system substrate-binding protein